MPELPEVETVRRGLDQSVAGGQLHRLTLARPDLRVPFTPGMARRLEGKRLDSVGRRAKYLLLRFDSGDTVILHLGMSGRIRVGKPGKISQEKHDHAVFSFNGAEMRFSDPRRFGLMVLAKETELAEHPLLAGIGPEPFSDAFSAHYLSEALAKRRGPVKTALLDQKLIAGVGNIYACEALFRAGIHPETPCHQTTEKTEIIIASIRAVLGEAIDSGGSSLRDYVQANGEMGYFQHHFRVYGREKKPCITCNKPIHAQRQAGRSTFFCPVCQPCR